MSLTSRILEAAACNGTHHKLAFQALDLLESPNAAKWKDLFLLHHKAYLRGSKAPDKEFKDFKNHVLHVGDNLWGGAREEAENWFQKTVSALEAENWKDAAFAAGVLSHYLSDPLMPFHTEQSEAESNIHRAFEWSVAKSYDQMKPEISRAAREFPVRSDDLSKMVETAARFSNQNYQYLIDEYDFAAGTKDPPKGLNQSSRDRLAVYIGYAQKLQALVLDRAIEESGVEPPNTNLTPTSVLALIEIPIAWVTRKMADAEERKIVEAMFREYGEKGVVDETLTEDVRVIRDLRREEEPPSEPKPVSEKPKRIRKSRKNRITPDSDLADAPSIGKRTAFHFSKANVYTVGDLIEADPAKLARKIGRNYITAEVIHDWQDQARLACELPRLRGHDVQILVGGGIRSLIDLADTQPETILEKVLPFVESAEGQRVVKPGNEPTIDEVKRWIGFAEEAVLAS